MDHPVYPSETAQVEGPAVVGGGEEHVADIGGEVNIGVVGVLEDVLTFKDLQILLCGFFRLLLLLILALILLDCYSVVSCDFKAAFSALEGTSKLRLCHCTIEPAVS